MNADQDADSPSPPAASGPTTGTAGPMTAERWQSLQHQLALALAVPPQQRRAFLDALAATDPALSDEVASLLAQEPALANFLDTDAARGAFREAGRVTTLIGQTLGPYRITALLGEGGMGDVYRASRVDDQYQAEVAIKVVRAGRDSRLIVSRFLQERQILASLSHPNIAHLLDGGAADDGTPYIVMELVAGEPIDDYCRRLALGITQRLELYLQVCAAVQYAHQRLIVHRDLKPGNILVTADGVPKLLDFGIAKLLDAGPATASPDPTATLMRALTPAYASPEQIRGEPMTTAGDVYSLGVVLYELLTGQSPYGMKPASAAELSRAVCETEPERPSAALRRVTLRPAAPDAASRATETGGDPQPAPHELSRRLRGDLDSIVLKALRKEPELRYATAEQLADDIRRYLGGLPVLARNGTRRYRASKFAARHALGLTAAAAVTILLVAGVFSVLHEARIAERRFDEVRQLTHAMIFDVHDAIKSLPGATPARKLIVERALEYLRRIGDEAQGDLGLQREVAAAYERVGLVQGQYLQASLGDTKGSLESYQRALALRARVAAATRDWHDELALAKAGGLVAIQQFALGQVPAAKSGIASVLARIEALDRAHPREPSVLLELGYNYEFAGEIAAGDDRAAERYYARMTESDAQFLVLRPDDLPARDRYSSGLMDYGEVIAKRDLGAAIAVFRKGMEVEQALHDLAPKVAQYSRGVALAYSRLGNAYQSLGDLQAAYDSLKRGLDISVAIAHDDPQNTYFQQGAAIAYANTGNALCALRADPKCLEYIDEGLGILQGLSRRDPANTRIPHYVAALVGVRAAALLHLDRWNESLREFEKASRLEQPAGNALAAADSPLTAWRQQMGQAAARAGSTTQAAGYFREVLRVVEPATRDTAADDDLILLASDSHAWLGQLQLQQAKHGGGAAATRRAAWLAARDEFRLSQAAGQRVAHPHPMDFDTFGVGDPKRVADALKECEAALAGGAS